MLPNGWWIVTTQRPQTTLLLGDSDYEYSWANGGELAWSPDGDHVLAWGLSHDIENSPCPSAPSYEAWLVSRAGERIRRLEPGGGCRVAWSPDGTRYVTGPPVEIRQPDVPEVRSLGDGGAWCLACSPDGATVAADQGENVALWDVASGQVTRVLAGGGERPRALSWSPDGTRLVVGWAKGAAVVFDTATGAEAVRFGESSDVVVVQWSPDGTLVGLLEADRRTVGLYDPASGARQQGVSGHGTSVSWFAWSPDGLLVATAGTDYTVRVWRVASGRQVLRMNEDECSLPERLAWSPDGALLAGICWVGGKYSHRLRIWDMSDRQTWNDYLPTETPGLEWRTCGDVPVCGVAVSPDGATLVTGHGDGMLRAWSVASGTSLWQSLVGDARGARPAAFFGGGDRLLCSGAGGTVRVLRVDDGSCALTIDEFAIPSDRYQYWLHDVRVTNDGRCVSTVVGDREQSVLQVWDGAAGDELWRAATNQSFKTAWGAGERLAYTTYERLVVAAGRNGEVLWEQKVSFLEAMQWHPAGQVLFVVGTGYAAAADGGSGKVLWRQALEPSGMSPKLACAPDGSLLAATVDWGKVVHILDGTTGVRQLVLTGHTGQIEALAWSGDGRLLVTASADQSVRIWDPRLGTVVACFEYAEGQPHEVSWSDDGRVLVASARGTVVPVWQRDVDTGRAG